MKLLPLLLVLSFSSWAQTVADHYIVELSSDSVARTAHREHMPLRNSNPVLAARRASILDEQSRLRRSMESSGAQVLDSFQTVHNGMVVRMSRDQANQLRSQ